MKNEFIPYKQALELKNLGFDEPCLAFFSMELQKPFNITFHQGLWESNTSQKECKNNYLGMLAPLYQQAFRWFREKHNLRGSMMDFIDDKTGIEWDFEIAIIGTDVNNKGEYEPLVDYSVDDLTRKFITYEDCQLACLIKLIEIVKNKLG